MKHFFGNAIIGIALVLVLSACPTINRNVDYTYRESGSIDKKPEPGSIGRTPVLVLKDYRSAGIIIVKATEEIDEMGNHTGSQITFEMLMLEAQKLGADDVINVRIDLNYKEHFSSDGELEKRTYNYTATALAIKYTESLTVERPR
jgi:uncharacterized protein YbjQ (UPF0145 family)